ncbi:hypothetical protein V6N13_091093 [Hibiscus sabdariffa]
MLLLLLCKCFDVLPQQDDKGDASNRDNGSSLGRNLGGNSDLGRASCCVIGLSLSPNNCSACSYTISLDGKYSDENAIPFQIPPLCPGQGISAGNLL